MLWSKQDESLRIQDFVGLSRWISPSKMGVMFAGIRHFFAVRAGILGGLVLLAGFAQVGWMAEEGEPSTKSLVWLVQDSQATQTFVASKDRVKLMLQEALTGLAGSSSVDAAWKSLLKPEDRLGIKVNSKPGRLLGTRLAVVESVLEGLRDSGIDLHRVVVWDRSLEDLHAAGFSSLKDRYGVRVLGAMQFGYDEKVFYESSILGKPVWGDHEFGKEGPGIGRKSYVTKILTQEVDKVIHIPALVNHNLAGTHGALVGMALGSVDNTLRFEADIHRLAIAVPEIYAIPEIGDRVIFTLVDGLLCQYLGEGAGLLHYSVPLNQLRLGRDPVALDVLSLKELAYQRAKLKFTEPRKGYEELYENSGLMELGVAREFFIQVIRNQTN